MMKANTWSSVGNALMGFFASRNINFLLLMSKNHNYASLECDVESISSSFKSVALTLTPFPTLKALACNAPSRPPKSARGRQNEVQFSYTKRIRLFKPWADQTNLISAMRLNLAISHIFLEKRGPAQWSYRPASSSPCSFLETIQNNA